MLSVHGRKPAAVVVEPVAKGLLKIGLTPNATTVAGTVLTMLTAMVLIPTGHLVWAAVLSLLFAAFDMVDGTMARLRGEAGGLKIVGGLIERPERLILGLGGIALEGFGVPNAVVVSLWILLIGSVITVVQRLMFAGRDRGADAKIAPPAGA